MSAFRSLVFGWRQVLSRRVSLKWSTFPRLLRGQRMLKVTTATGLLAAPLCQLKRAKATTENTQLPEVLKHADELYEEDKMRKALESLEPYATTGDAEVLWRLARLCYKVGRFHSSGKEESKKMAELALKYSEDSIQADGVNFACFKWSGIVISYMTEFVGYKEQIKRSYEVKEQFLKASELNPKDATCRHLLGQWCYSVVDFPWYQRQFATILFATPPNSSFEEALSHFQAAEEVKPGFYNTNWLYLGKTHLKLGHKEEARKWLQLAAGSKSTRGDDVESREEAEKLLKNL